MKFDWFNFKKGTEATRLQATRQQGSKATGTKYLLSPSHFNPTPHTPHLTPHLTPHTTSHTPHLTPHT